MSATAYLTQPRTPDGRWDRTGRTGPAGVRLDLTDEADVADVLDRIRAAGARRIATLAYVADQRDLAEEFEANTFEFVYERATAADPDHPAITAAKSAGSSTAPGPGTSTTCAPTACTPA